DLLMERSCLIRCQALLGSSRLQVFSTTAMEDYGSEPGTEGLCTCIRERSMGSPNPMAYRAKMYPSFSRIVKAAFGLLPMKVSIAFGTSPLPPLARSRVCRIQLSRPLLRAGMEVFGLLLMEASTDGRVDNSRLHKPAAPNMTVNSMDFLHMPFFRMLAGEFGSPLPAGSATLKMVVLF